MLARPRGPRQAWPVVASAVLVAGFADLVRGGITVGPVALVAAYVVLVPLAILRSVRR